MIYTQFLFVMIRYSNGVSASTFRHVFWCQDSPEAQVGDVCTNQPLGGFTKRLDATLNEFL